MKLYIAPGIVNSQKVLTLLKKDKRLKDIEVFVGTFHNCRECGYTFKVSKANGVDKSFTFIVYEHRNSDSIIVNGHEGYWSAMNGAELPFRGDSKWTYWGCFGYKEYEKAANYLGQEIERFHRTGEVKADESGSVDKD